MERLDVPSDAKPRGKASILEGNSLSLGRVKTHFRHERSSSTPSFCIDSVDVEEYEFDFTDLFAPAILSGHSEEPLISSSWDEKGKTVFPHSSMMETPIWIANEKSKLLGYEAMKQCLQILTRKSKKSIKVYAECLDCLAYCSLFPKDYEIEGDELVQLWVASGLIQKEPMEYTAIGYLSALQEFWNGFFSLSREDYRTGNKWYKLSKQLLTSRLNPVRVDYFDDPIRVLSAQTEPFRATFRNLSPNLELLCGFTEMRMVLLLRGHASPHIDHVPYKFFILLKLLQVLDLSGTKVSELPSSIGCAKRLRYLDLSQTLIKRLPESIDCLSELQTLKLRDCPRLLALPKSLSLVTSLRHLDLGTLCHLRSMPSGMGALTRLYTLSNFIVGQESGCCIGELQNMHNLAGRVCLSRLENVGSVDDTKKASLYCKRGITKLELRWTNNIEWDNIADDDHGRKQVIEYLLPPFTLEDLRIVCYGGLKLPSWISKPSLYKLKSITLFKCENCQLLPCLGQLPSLVSLSLIELVEVKIIDLHFCSETVYGNDIVAFPKLLKLEIKSLLSLQEWRDMGKVSYFPCLTKLVIKDCPQLTTLCRLSNIHCLEYLEINHCAKLPSLPEGGLPALLKTFVIEECTLLSSSCSTSMEETQDWHKTEHTSSLLMYQREETK